jgi:regulator of protease activity HflC (stomatin/prohibitin superfamily)
VGGLAQKEALILEAEGDLAEAVPRANAEAVKRVNEAKAAAATKVEVALGEADQFVSQLAANQAAPTIYKHRTRMETLARAMAKSRKYVVVSTNAHRVMQIDLQEKIRQDIEDAQIETPNKP